MTRTIVAFSIYVLGGMLAISAAAKVPADGRTWPDTLPMFAVGVAICVAGLVAWHVSVRTRRKDAAGEGGGLEAMFARIRDARSEVAAMAEQWESLDSEAIRQWIDRVALDCIDPFVEGRDLVIRRYGMRQGAELILALATAERNLNRVWSAAADDCLPEAWLALQASLTAFDELLALVDAQ